MPAHCAHLDSVATNHPNTNGCECATPGCCPGALCQNTHANGVGDSFYDCVAVGTHDLARRHGLRDDGQLSPI